MKLKVCGMRDPENIKAVAALNPAMMGFIFYNKSRRNVQPSLSKDILENLPKRIDKVAVFVNPTFSEVQSILEKYPFEYIQLHGDESVELIRQLRQLKAGIIKVIAGNREFDVPYIKRLEPLIDYWLIDTKTDQYGGTGIQFNRQVLESMTFSKSVLLSGGLDEAAVRSIKQEAWPMVAGVDVNSKMEDAPGMKNIEKIKEVIACLK